MTKIQIKRSPLHGFGVFAKKDIKRGEVIEDAPYIQITQRWKDVPSKLKEYVFTDPYGKDNQFLVVFGSGSIYNHSDKNNCKYEIDNTKRVMQYISKRDIKKGEEIFVNYGKDYWHGKKRQKQ